MIQDIVIYLDHHATTPVAEPVLERMFPYFRERFGNAASGSHALGWRAREAVDVARGHVAAMLGATAREIYFTSGATEANNLAIWGTAKLHAEPGHMITQVTEHAAVLGPMRALAKEGWRITELPVDSHGRISLTDLEQAFRKDTRLVSIMAANNEIGTLQDLHAIGEQCRARDVWLHSDATQLVPWGAIDLGSLPVDLLSLSAHKMSGPKGVGALYLRRRDPRVSLAPLMVGGGHERGVRPGSLNVPGIVGLGAAAELVSTGSVDPNAVRKQRDALQARLSAAFEDIVINGHPSERLPGNLHFAIPGVDAELLTLRAPDLAFSSGSACASGSGAPSHVLSGIGLKPELVRGSVRLGLGEGLSEADLQQAGDILISAARSIRGQGALALSPKGD